MRILVLADHSLVHSVREGLRADGMIVESAREADITNNGDRRLSCDALLLDPKQLKEPNWSQLAGWRRQGLEVPILVLLPRNSGGAERAAYLDSGADTCLLQPLSIEELKAHLRALQRRSLMQLSPVQRIHDLEINMATRSAVRAGQTIHLTPREFDLLHLLATHPGEVLSRSRILEKLYDDNQVSSSNVIDVYVGYLRNKIDRGFKMPLILTRWGQGYLLRPEGA